MAKKRVRSFSIFLWLLHWHNLPAYRNLPPARKPKAQALNDFSVFTLVTIASLSAGYFPHNFGWKAVNIGAMPLILMFLLSIVWLMRIPEQKRLHSN